MGSESDNKGRSRSRGQGHSDDKKRDKTKSKPGQIPIDKSMFATGDNQAENFQRLKKHLGQKASLGGCGAEMAHILCEDEEHKHQPPQLKATTIVLTDKSDDKDEIEKERPYKKMNVLAKLRRLNLIKGLINALRINKSYALALQRNETLLLKPNWKRWMIISNLLLKIQSSIKRD